MLLFIDIKADTKVTFSSTAVNMANEICRFQSVEILRCLYIYLHIHIQL
jgi:hypothetical protein